MTSALSENRKRKLRPPALLAAVVLLFSLPACSVGSQAVRSDTASVSSEVSSAPESSSYAPSSDTTSFEIPSESPLTSFFSSDYVKGEYADEYSSVISSEVMSVPAEPIYVNVWSPSEDGQSISYAAKEVTSVTYSKVFSLLRKAGVVSSAIYVNNFARSYDGDKSYLMLDLSENFTSYLKNCGREDAVMGSIVNTFLEAYGAEKILITVKKYTLKTSKRTYAGVLTRYSPDLYDLGYNVITPIDTGVTPTKKVAITFDDGPHYGYTWLIMDKLRQYGATATFFSIGENLWGSGADAVASAYSYGNEVGIHAYTHDYNYKTCSDKNYSREITKTANAIQSLTKIYPTLMRPVGGSISAERVKASSFAVIHWSIDSNDWRYKTRDTVATREANVQKIANNVLKANVRDGDIILMHELYGNSFDAFCIIIEELYKRGFEVVTVSELLSNPAPGKLYYHGR